MTDSDTSRTHADRAEHTNEPTRQSGRVALAPDLRSMPDRSARAWAERMAVRPLGDGRYAVDSESGATYVVEPPAGTCTCPDADIRGETCKHLRRVAIEITTRRVPPPGERRDDCAACGEQALVSADGDLPLCGPCRIEPGDVVDDRETGDRLVVTAVTDDRANGVTVPGAGVTVADYPTNEGYRDDDILIKASYLADIATDGVPRRYSFPRSRLRQADDSAFADRR
jgi:hypothetical protein